jgi:hypothetical protein
MKSVAELKQEIVEHYTDVFGYMDHCKKDPEILPASGNGRLYTAQAYILLKRLGDPIKVDDKGFLVLPLNQRHPMLNYGTEEHDNIVGLTAMKLAPGYMYYMCKKFPLYKIPNGKSLAPHVAFIINFCAGKCWGPINTLWFIIMLLTSPFKKHDNGNPNAGVRLMGWTYINPLVERWPSFGGWIERRYWKAANINDCAKRYYGDTPWYGLYWHLGHKIFKTPEWIVKEMVA